MAVNLNTNQKVAIKIMKNSGKAVANLLDAFVNEVAILSELQHKYVIHLKDFELNGIQERQNGSCKRIVYYVMSLAENGELFRLIEETEGFSEKLARYYFRQLITSIEYLHEAGYSHRDIKTENILIDVNYRLKIADFGFASRYVDKQTLKKIPMDPNIRAVGSPMTNAPQITNHSQQYYGDEVDLFAAGCVLFSMVMKTPPFKSSNFKDEYYSRFLNEDKTSFWKIFEGIAKPTKEFKDLLQRLLNPDPKQRIKLQEVKTHFWYRGQVMSKAERTKEMQIRFKKVGNIIKNERQALIKAKLLKYKSSQRSPRHLEDASNLPRLEIPRELMEKVALLRSRLRDSESSDGSSSDRRTQEDKREPYQSQQE